MSADVTPEGQGCLASRPDDAVCAFEDYLDRAFYSAAQREWANSILAAVRRIVDKTDGMCMSCRHWTTTSCPVNQHAATGVTTRPSGSNHGCDTYSPDGNLNDDIFARKLRQRQLERLVLSARLLVQEAEKGPEPEALPDKRKVLRFRLKTPSAQEQTKCMVKDALRRVS